MIVTYRYSDRESGDFLFDYHPRYPSLFVAAGGSGHAFSFVLPFPSFLSLAPFSVTDFKECDRIYAINGILDLEFFARQVGGRVEEVVELGRRCYEVG